MLHVCRDLRIILVYGKKKIKCVHFKWGGGGNQILLELHIWFSKNHVIFGKYYL